MVLKRLFVAVALVTLLVLQVGTCVTASANPQDMKCCGSMPCTPHNQDQGCCRSMVSPQAPNMLPAQHASLQAPAVALVQYIRIVDLAQGLPYPAITAPRSPQHSPPELYTLHSSLLI